MVNLGINIGDLHFKNPVMTASGTFGYGPEFDDFIDVSRLGAIFIKGLTLEPREGNKYPRMAETPAGMLNAVGLQNKGIEYFENTIYPRIKDYETHIIVNINGKRDYWQHIFWMPDVPVFVKPLLAAVEIMGLFIKPLTLMLRLAGNISAGHIAILSFIGLIFIFGESGANFGGGIIGTAMAIPLTLFMMAIELIVAFVQAFVFTILTASYIGAAIEEHHHAEGHH